MSIFKSKGIIYFSRKEIKIYSQRLEDPIVIPFKESIVSNLDNLNIPLLLNEFNELPVKLGKKFSLKSHKFIIVLSDDLVFSKSIKVDGNTVENKDKLIKDFVEAIPLPPDDIGFKDCIRDDNLILTATSKTIYENFIKILKKFQSEIYILTTSAFIDNIDLNRKTIDLLFHKIDLFRYGNYLYDYKPKSQVEKIFEKIIYVMIVLLVFFGIFMIFSKNPGLLPWLWLQVNYVISWVITFFGNFSKWFLGFITYLSSVSGTNFNYISQWASTVAWPWFQNIFSYVTNQVNFFYQD